MAWANPCELLIDPAIIRAKVHEINAKIDPSLRAQSDLAPYRQFLLDLRNAAIAMNWNDRASFDLWFYGRSDLVPKSTRNGLSALISLLDRESCSGDCQLAVRQEVREFKNSGFRNGDIHHTTMSAALPGIAEHQALLSGREILARGGLIRSGEFQSLWGSSVLNEVYAYAGPPGALIFHHSWFFDYPVTFAINIYGQHNWYKAPQRTDSPDHGIRLGTEVPMEALKGAYAPKAHLPSLVKWASEHAPRLKVISFEAAKLLEEGSIEVTPAPYGSVNLGGMLGPIKEE